jgi:hypothetical protein
MLIADHKLEVLGNHIPVSYQSIDLIQLNVVAVSNFELQLGQLHLLLLIILSLLQQVVVYGYDLNLELEAAQLFYGLLYLLCYIYSGLGIA